VWAAAEGAAEDAERLKLPAGRRGDVMGSDVRGAHLVTLAFEVSTDQVLGVEQTKPNEGRRDNRLWRRFRQVEKLSPAQRKPIIQVLNAFLQGTPPKRG